MTRIGKLPTRKVEPIYNADKSCFSHILGSYRFCQSCQSRGKKKWSHLLNVYQWDCVFSISTFTNYLFRPLPSFWLLPWKPVSAYYVSLTMVLMSYLLQTENKGLCTLNFVYLSCFTHCFFDDITIVIIILEKKFE